MINAMQWGIPKGIDSKTVAARHGGTHLESQLLGRLRQEDGLSPGVQGCSSAN